MLFVGEVHECFSFLIFIKIRAWGLVFLFKWLYTFIFGAFYSLLLSVSHGSVFKTVFWPTFIMVYFKHIVTWIRSCLISTLTYLIFLYLYNKCYAVNVYKLNVLTSIDKTTPNTKHMTKPLILVSQLNFVASENCQLKYIYVYYCICHVCYKLTCFDCFIKFTTWIFLPFFLQLSRTIKGRKQSWQFKNETIQMTKNCKFLKTLQTFLLIFEDFEFKNLTTLSDALNIINWLTKSVNVSCFILFFHGMKTLFWSMTLI